MLAKNSKAPRSFSKHALSLKFFASKLALTESYDRCRAGRYSNKQYSPRQISQQKIAVHTLWEKKCAPCSIRLTENTLPRLTAKMNA